MMVGAFRGFDSGLYGSRRFGMFDLCDACGGVFWRGISPFVARDSSKPNPFWVELTPNGVRRGDSPSVYKLAQQIQFRKLFDSPSDRCRCDADSDRRWLFEENGLLMHRFGRECGLTKELISHLRDELDAQPTDAQQFLFEGALRGSAWGEYPYEHISWLVFGRMGRCRACGLAVCWPYLGPLSESVVDQEDHTQEILADEFLARRRCTCFPSKDVLWLLMENGPIQRRFGLEFGVNPDMSRLFNQELDEISEKFYSGHLTRQSFRIAWRQVIERHGDL